MSSVKPFKSKNRDKVILDAPNPNLKGCDTYGRDFRATAQPINYYVGFIGKILFELYETFHPIKQHNSL